MIITAMTLISVTLFDDYGARAKIEKLLTLGDLADNIRRTNRDGDNVDAAKAVLPWLKLAQLGNARTPKGSLRFDRNVISISGAEGDYDAEKIDFDDAVELLEKAGIGALIYTSPSYTAQRWRWRVLCPTSTHLAPARRAGLVSRANGVLKGGLAPESWKLSQSYYFGSVNNNPLHRVVIVEGEPIDLLDDLDLIAIDQPKVTGKGRGGGHPSHPSAPGEHRPSPLGPAAGDMLDVVAALAALDNSAKDWERWNYILMAVHAATAGSLAGYAAIVDWSQKAGADVFDLDVTKQRWKAISDDPTVRGDLGFGTLLQLAREAWPGFERPSEMRRRRDNDPGEPPAHLIDPAIPVDTSKSNGHDQTAGNGHDPEASWGAPREEEPWPEIEAEAFDGLAGDIVRAIENETEADPVALLISLLVMVGNMLGRGPHAVVGRVIHRTNLYAVFVGATARGRKGTSEADVTAILSTAESDWALKQIESGLSSGEGVIWRVHDEIVVREKIKGKDGKPQYIGVIKEPNVEDKRLMIVEPEFAGTLAVMKRDGSILSRVLRDAWDGRRLATLTKNANTHATGAHVSMIAHITADDLRTSLDRVSFFNGYANRYLFVCVKRSKLLPFGGVVEEGVITHLADRLRETCDVAQVTLARRPLSFDKEAREMWAAEYRTSLSVDRPGLFGAVTARAEAHTLRLAALYAVLDHCRYISRRHLFAALAVWRYCEASARYTFGDAVGDPLADEVLDVLRSGSQGGMTRTELYNFWGRNRSSDDIGKALRLLLKHNKVQRRERPSKGGGRPAEIWVAP